jgi:hypothetical protein
VNLKPVCFLLSLCHVAPAAALGLGEIAVRSSLGQPLHATVVLLDAPAALTADCFSLSATPGSITPPLRAKLSIEQTAAHTQLHVRTSQSIQDPVAQFVLTSDCEARLQREYVILLDPPAQPGPSIAHEQPAAAQTNAQPAPMGAPRARHARRAKHTVPVTTRASRQTAAPAAHATTRSTAPRLVLSGKRRAYPAGASGLSLQLDTTLPDLALIRPEKLDPTELSDENTALGHKLAYLETQLAALQKRNAELETRRAASATKPAVPPPLKSAATPQWPVYLLVVGLLGSAGILVAWMRSRRHDRQFLTVTDDVAWAQPATSPTAETAPAAEPVAELAFERMAEIAAPLHEEGTEIKEDILDQAEVFMAHGHGDIAIHLLQEHLREAPTESPIPWLLLLDLLHRAGDEAGYAAASTECRRYFNVNFGSHPVSHAQENGLGLEAYPHLLDRLTHEWNSPNVDAFFNELIYDDRGGTRVGFEPGAYRDIVLLQAIARDVLPLAA